MSDENRSAVITGLFVVICGIMIIGAIFVLGRRSQFFREHYILNAPFKDVQGLESGSFVRVAGVNVGTVTNVALSPDPNRKEVVAKLRIDTNYRTHIREDSMASIKALGLLGDKYIEISMGTSESRELRDNDKIQTEEPIDFYMVAEEARSSVRLLTRTATSLNELLDQFQRSRTLANLENTTDSISNILDAIEEGPGGLHTLLFDEKFQKMFDDLEQSVAILNNTLESVTTDERGMARALLGEDFDDSIENLKASTDGLRRIIEEVETGDGMIHRLVFSNEDAEMLTQFKLAAAEIEDMVRVIRDGDGLLNRMIYDREEAETITEVRMAAARLKSILEKIDSEEGTIGLLISDPAVWEDMRRLLGGVQRSRTLMFLINRSLKEMEQAEK